MEKRHGEPVESDGRSGEAPGDGSRDGAGKARWRSRRGMLEVEAELLPFVRERFDGLPAADREAYARLLEEDDWVIHDWLRGVMQPADAALRRILTLIRESRSGAGAGADDGSAPPAVRAGNDAGGGDARDG